MKSTMSAPARDYVRAFYRDNRLNLSAALALTVLDVPAALVGSWLLGRIIDVIGTGDASALARLAVFCGAFLLASLAVSLGMYRAKCAFIYRALAQYKSLAFERLSEKGVRAFARENTGSYLSLLTNDVTSVEEGYLVRGGQIDSPVRGASLIGRGGEVLMKIDRVGREMTMEQGMCGSISGSVPVNVGQPMIRVSSITVGGK